MQPARVAWDTVGCAAVNWAVSGAPEVMLSGAMLHVGSCSAQRFGQCASMRAATQQPAAAAAGVVISRTERHALADADARQAGAGPGPGSVHDAQAASAPGRWRASIKDSGSSTERSMGSSRRVNEQNTDASTARSSPAQDSAALPAAHIASHRAIEEGTGPQRQVNQHHAPVGAHDKRRQLNNRVVDSRISSSSRSGGSDAAANHRPQFHLDKRGPPDNPAVLTSWISKATHIYYLRNLLVRMSWYMDTGHVVQVAYKLAQIVRSTPPSTGAQLQPKREGTSSGDGSSTSTSTRDSTSGRDSSSTSNGVSTPAGRLPTASNAATCPRVAEQQEAAWQLARLCALAAPHLTSQPPGFTLDQAVTLLWSAAHILGGARPPGKASSWAPGWTTPDRNWSHILPQLDHLVGVLCEMLQEPQVRVADHRLCMAVWAVAHLELAAPGRWVGAAPDLAPDSFQGAGRDLAPGAQRLLRLLSAAVARAAHRLSVRDVASCMWALAACGRPDQAAFAALVARAEVLLRGAVPEGGASSQLGQGQPRQQQQQDERQQQQPEEQEEGRNGRQRDFFQPAVEFGIKGARQARSAARDSTEADASPTPDRGLRPTFNAAVRGMACGMTAWHCIWAHPCCWPVGSCMSTLLQPSQPIP